MTALKCEKLVKAIISLETASTYITGVTTVITGQNSLPQNLTVTIKLVRHQPVKNAEIAKFKRREQPILDPNKPHYKTRKMH